MLNVTKKQTMDCFALPESDLNKTYGEGKWSVRQILHHLTDCELLFHGRLKKIIAEPKQVIWAFNQDDWNEAFDYKNETLKGKKGVFEMCRDLNYELMDKFYETYIDKEFVHNETGLRTLKEEFEKVALHNQKHLDQIEMALKK